MDLDEFGRPRAMGTTLGIRKGDRMCYTHNDVVFRFKLKTECTMCKKIMIKLTLLPDVNCHVIKVTGYCFSLFATDGQRLFTL